MAGQNGRSSRYQNLVRDQRLGEALKELKRNGGGIRRERNQEAVDVVTEKLGRGKHEYRDAMKILNEMRDKKEIGEDLVISPELVYKVFQTRSKNRGGGLSGITFRHWGDALEAVEVRKELLEEQAKLISLLVNARMPTKLFPYLNGGKGGIADRRLFMAGEVIVRLAEAIMQQQVQEKRRKQVAKLEKKPLFKFNVGVGVSGAADCLRFWVLENLKKNAGREDLVILEVDAANMFLELKRAEILRVVRAEVPQLFPMLVHLSTPQFVSFFRGKLKAQLIDGVSIGSSLASLVASLVEEKIMVDLELWCTQRGIWAEMKAFIDNIFIITTAGEAKKILERLEETGKVVGLVYALRECHPHKVHFPFTNKLSIPLELWKEGFVGFEFSAARDDQEEQGIRLAGVEIGSPAHYLKRAARKFDKSMKDLEFVVEKARPQEALLMIRNAILPSVDFVRRMLPLEATEELARSFDLAVVRSVQKLAKGAGDWAADETKRLWLAQGNGLLGLRQLESSGEAAQIASFVSAARSNPILDLTRGVMQSISVYNTRVTTGKIKVSTTAELLERTSKWRRVQKRLVEPIRMETRGKLRSRLKGTDDLIKLDAMQEKKAGVWLKDLDFGTALEFSGFEELFFSDEVFRYLLRRSMPGEDPHGTGMKEFTCKWCMCGFSTVMTHAETCCTKVRGANRHNAFQEAVMRLVHSLGGFARASELTMYETPKCDGSVPMCAGCDDCEKTSGVRVDVEFGGLADDGYYAVDVGNVEILRKNVRYPMRPDGKLAVQKPIEEAEAIKRGTYAAMCAEKTEREFIPVIMSSFGAPGAGTSKLVAILAERLQRVMGGATNACKRIILRRLQAVNMREIALNGIRALREHRIDINLVRSRVNLRAQQPQGAVAPEVATALFMQQNF